MPNKTLHLIAISLRSIAAGECVGDLVTAEIPGAGRITFVYLTDPEGNIIELQKWE